MGWCEDFIAAFNTHAVEPMLAICAPDIKWEDVSGHIDYEGHDGVKNMVELTLMAIPDCKFTYHGGLKDKNSTWSSGRCRELRSESNSPAVAHLSAKPTTRTASSTTGITGIPAHSR